MLTKFCGQDYRHSDIRQSSQATILSPSYGNENYCYSYIYHKTNNRINAPKLGTLILLSNDWCFFQYLMFFPINNK